MESTDYFFGEDGMGDNNEPLTGLVPAQKQGAVETLLELSKKYEGNDCTEYCVFIYSL